jgi:hypothetical protein
MLPEVAGMWRGRGSNLVASSFGLRSGLRQSGRRLRAVFDPGAPQADIHPSQRAGRGPRNGPGFQPLVLLLLRGVGEDGAGSLSR